MGETDGKEPAKYWGDTSLRADEVETVRAGICARFDGEARDELLGMLLDGVQVRDTTEAAPRMPRSKGAGMSENMATVEAIEETTKPKRGPAVAPTASGRTKAQLAVIRAWAIENGVRHTVTGRMPRATIEAYDAAHAGAVAVEAPRPKPPRKLKPMKPAVQPPALSEPVENELTGIRSAVTASPDVATFPAATAASNLAATSSKVADPVRLIAERRQAEAALDLVLRKWDAERTHRRGQSALLRSMARQVILAEQERRYDADVLEGMDRALASAYEMIQDLQQQLEQARATPAPWWKRAAS